ncbi:Y-family DNA polymerase [Paraferrimonas sedimenticola]|uniref:DNA repair nucleotidyltransferase n=1 Tax=Paraferrimonas sedimenticola TaxID=375674 RepID=A0AA37RW06_9GAMM|nr:DNA polymerase Y family protein [Paraferrimonas sedimenticola]GLP96173.1 DNA repair nucleotidyltransferase [Paraferrimonas sedimenticola]
MWWLAVHEPQLELNYLRRGESEQEWLEPAALMAGKPAKVMQANLAAAKAGVSFGQSMATATALVSDLRLYSAYPELSDESLKWLAHWSYRFSARVCLREPGCVLLEIGSMIKLFGSIGQLLDNYRHVAELHLLNPNLAIADNPLAAELLARSHQPQHQLSRPKVQQALGRLAVEQLGLEPSAVASLKGMGLTHFHELQALPQAELGLRFGGDLVELVAKLKGQLPQPLEFYQPPQGYQRRLPLNHEIELLSVLQFPLQRLLGELQLYLQQRQLAVNCWKLWLKYRDGEQEWLTFELAFAEHQAAKLLQLAQLQLERHQLTAPVIEMGIKVARFGALQGNNKSWLPQKGNYEKQQLVARLQARLGEQRVKGLGLQDQHRPELAWQTLAANNTEQSLSTKVSPGQRPNWLLPQALPIKRQQLMLLRGPERIESGWWDEHWVQRDYYLARHDNGALCWVYRSADAQDQLQKQWFVHGWFG